MISPILPLYERADLDFSHGEGVYLYTTDGKRYLDFASGYAALALGHCHPKMVEAIQMQSKKLWHLSNRYKIPGMYEYCKKLIDNSFADTMFMANSGAEAVECMIKMTRRYFNEKGQLNRYHIITLEGAFHGRTLACATAGSAEKIKGFEPPVEGFDRVPFNDIEALKKAITKDTAGIMIELIQGEGGMRPLSDEYVKELRAICDKEGILLLIDEVQSGMGRTGDLFAYATYGVKPDLVALGKGLGSGYPVSACLATEEVGKAMKSGSHGSTFGGNPMAIAVGNVVLDVMLERGFLDGVKLVSNYLKEELEKLAVKYPKYIECITGKGLMLGIKFRKDVEVEYFTNLCRDNLILSIPASGNVMRLTPPLIIDNKHVDEAISCLSKALDQLGSPTKKIGYKVKTVVKSIIRKVGLKKE
jgi:acetylornithine/N-succinyldiaminopimelate aminotransferase